MTMRKPWPIALNTLFRIENVFATTFFMVFNCLSVIVSSLAPSFFHGGVFQSSGSRLVTNGLARASNENPWRTPSLYSRYLLLSLLMSIILARRRYSVIRREISTVTLRESSRKRRSIIYHHWTDRTIPLSHTDFHLGKIVIWFFRIKINCNFVKIFLAAKIIYINQKILLCVLYIFLFYSPNS